MALSSTSSLSAKSPLPTYQNQSIFPSKLLQQSLPLLPTKSNRPISAVHAAEPSKTPLVANKPSKAAAPAAPTKWAVDSWRSMKALQLPEYPNQQELESVLKTIEAFPPIVFAGEARHLEERLADAAMGKAFLLQGGDCAESFKEFNAVNIRDTFRIILQMSVVLMFGGQMPVIKVGRMAGQFAKPRSDPFEEKDGVKLPSYRGDNINGDTFDEKSIMTMTEFWTSHECLLLLYDQSLTRQDSTSGLFYDCSAHMLWVGERTRQLDGAHVEFLRGIANPLGIKFGGEAKS